MELIIFIVMAVASISLTLFFGVASVVFTLQVLGVLGII